LRGISRVVASDFECCTSFVVNKAAEIGEIPSMAKMYAMQESITTQLHDPAFLRL
jgi:hypothetical protein